MASASASDVDTGIRTLSVARTPFDFSCDETVASATSAIASTTAISTGLFLGVPTQAQDR